MSNENLNDSSLDTEDQALNFLEQWLSAGGSDIPQPPVESPRGLDPSLRAIERLVSQHQELFRRHSRGTS